MPHRSIEHGPGREGAGPQAGVRVVSRRQVVGGLLGITASRTLARLPRGGRRGAPERPGGRPVGEAQLVSHPSPPPAKGEQWRHFVSRPDLVPPNVVVEVDRTGHDGRLIATDAHPGRGHQCGALLLDDKGDTVWFRPLGHTGSPGGHAFNLRVQSYKSRPVLTYFEGRIYEAHGVGVYRILDHRYRLLSTVSAKGGLHGDEHEFLITPWDTAVFTTYSRAYGDLRSLGGTARQAYIFCELQEVDIESGKLLFSWRSDRHVPLAESIGRPSPAGTPWDYFHMNSIAVDPEDGNYVVSSRLCWAVYKVDRKSGEVIWRLGGRKSDFEIEAGAEFSFQHDVAAYEGGLLSLFDNGYDAPAGSSGLVLHLDTKAMRARPVRRYVHRPSLDSPVLGSLQRLGGGHTFIGWGTTGWFTEYDATGRVLLDGHLEGTGLYRAFKVDWYGRPDEPPALVVKAAGASSSLAYVSWNGSTATVAWRLLAGASPGRLHPIGVARKKGFETVIELPGHPFHLRAEALDSAGRVLHASKVAALSGAKAATGRGRAEAPTIV